MRTHQHSSSVGKMENNVNVWKKKLVAQTQNMFFNYSQRTTTIRVDVLESYFRLKGKINPLAGPPVTWTTNAGQRIVTYYFKEGCMKDRDEIACTAAISRQFVRPYPDEPNICKSTCGVPLPEFLCHGTGPKEGTCFIHGILIISGRGRRCGLG